MVDELELNELQDIYAEMDANGRHQMLSIAESLLNAQNSGINESKFDCTLENTMEFKGVRK